MLRCFAASQRTTAAAVDTFIELTCPYIGIDTTKSHFSETNLEIPLPSDVSDMVMIAARMSSPISMLVMGMRLATMNFSKMFTNVRVYVTVFAKQIISPLVAFLLVYFLPVSYEVKCVFFIICACPVASVTLNYAEIVGEGQDEAASMVLVGTMLSILTLPLMMLLLPLFA